MTTRNPFRKENGLLSPQATGQTTASTSTPSLQTETLAPEITISQEQADREALNAEPDDLPPPYTPGPAAAEGETTLEFGPVRPFQQPPRIPPTLNAQPTGYNTLQPPIHPSANRHSTGNMSNMSTLSSSLSSSLSEFFNPQRRYAPPTTPTPSRGYAPPPGQPPTASVSAPRHAPPPGAPPTSPTSTSSNRSGVSRPPPRTSREEDGRPTTTPMPGHPLLRNNRICVYPQGYKCWKCDNTGFKSYDPTHPCRKCWERFSRPFEGPIVYAPWSSGVTSSNSDASTLQKPLPKFRAPPSSFYNSDTPRTISSGSANMAGSPRFGTLVQRPPANALIVQPGDPRIGGRLCWRCDGSGTVSFLIFDEETCPICNGSGRTHP